MPTRIVLAIFCLLLPQVNLALPRGALIGWNDAMLYGVRDSKLGAPIVARSLAIVDTCIYDAWAAYDERAVGTQLGAALRRPLAERTLANKERTISYAAYRALSNVLPVDTESVYKPLMKKLGYDPNDNSTDIETPQGIGNVACAAVLEARHRDKSNQLGDLAIAEGSGLKSQAIGAYGDWSGYRFVNSPNTIPAHFPASKPINPDHWQPLTHTNATGNLVLQMFEAAQWCFVAPFAMSKGDEFREMLAPGPAKYGSPQYRQQAEELITLSANLTDRQKMIVEHWDDASDSDQLIGRWVQFAQFISTRDCHSLDDDVKMFFALSNAMLDTSIATWDAKRAYDSARPVTAIPLLFNGETIRTWGGPGKGTVEMDGSRWIPYQASTSPTPPSPEFVSEHSALSAAAAQILKLWTGSDRFGDSVSFPVGSSVIEVGITPAKPVTLSWETFSQAADEAGMSRRYAGTQFRSGDESGRALGRTVAGLAWAKAQHYFSGTAMPTQPQ